MMFYVSSVSVVTNITMATPGAKNGLWTLIFVTCSYTGFRYGTCIGGKVGAELAHISLM